MKYRTEETEHDETELRKNRTVKKQNCDKKEHYRNRTMTKQNIQNKIFKKVKYS